MVSPPTIRAVGPVSSDACWPVAASQMRMTDSSLLPAMMRLPSGVTRSPWGVRGVG